jgi:hypothetical protein
MPVVNNVKEVIKVAPDATTGHPTGAFATAARRASAKAHGADPAHGQDGTAFHQAVVRKASMTAFDKTGFHGFINKYGLAEAPQEKKPGSLYRQTVRPRELEHIEEKISHTDVRFSIGDRLGYIRDQWMARTVTQMGMLLAVLCCLITGCGVIFSLVEDPAQSKGIVEDFWLVWGYMADPGTHADIEGLGPRLIAVIIAIAGILYFATVMGIIVDNVRESMELLKKGKSKVVETGHYLILGWTDRCPALLRELAMACESDGGGCVVILAEQDKVELEAELKNLLTKEDLRNLNVVFRTGSAMVTKDLNTVSASTAKTIIVLAGQGDAEQADATVLRSVLQLKGLKQELRGHIVAEMRDADNEHLVNMASDWTAETVVSHDIVGRLMLMSARQPGLASVYDALLGFQGDEFYLKAWPELAGTPFGRLQSVFADAVPIGIKVKATEKIHISPSPDMKIGPEDEVLVLAADDDSYSCSSTPLVETVFVTPEPHTYPMRCERILMCGWRRDVDDVIQQLDRLVMPGSELHMLSEVPVEERTAMLEAGGLHLESMGLNIVHHQGNPGVRRVLEALDINDYDSILVLADAQRENDMMHCDSHTLAVLLLLRDIQAMKFTEDKEGDEHGYGWRRFKAQTSGEIGCLCVCEVLDHRTRNTIQHSRSLRQAADFVQSNELISRVLAMVSERREVKAVLDELLGSSGSGIMMHEAARYASPYTPFDFYGMAVQCQQLGHILCGYKEHHGEVVLNPKDKERVIQDWSNYELIVLSPGSQNPASASPKKMPGHGRDNGAQGRASTTDHPSGHDEQEGDKGGGGASKKLWSAVVPSNDPEREPGSKQEGLLQAVQGKLGGLDSENKRKLCLELLRAEYGAAAADAVAAAEWNRASADAGGSQQPRKNSTVIAVAGTSSEI